MDEAIDQSYKTVGEKLAVLKELEKQIGAKTELRKVVNGYLRSKPVVAEGRKLKGKKAEQYCAAHEADYIIRDAALRRHVSLCRETVCHP